MSKKKLHLATDKVRPSISDLSPEEEARALELADIALLNHPAGGGGIWPAGSRAKEDLRKGMEELKREAEKIRYRKRVA